MRSLKRFSISFQRKPLWLGLLLIALLATGCLGQRLARAQQAVATVKLPSKVVTYPAPVNVDHVRDSERFQVRVNGEPLYVEEYRNVSYAHFSFAGSVEIEVTVPGRATTYTLSPTSYQLQPKATADTLRFDLQVPRKLVVHRSQASTGHALSAPILFLFADPLEAPLPATAAVIDVGARDIDQTGERDETARIQALIDEAAATGAILHFPPGTYRITSLRMQSDLTMHLAGGARLQVAPPPAGFREPALHFNTVENVRLFGRGVVDGNGVNIRYLPKETDDLRAVIYAYQAENIVVEGIIIQNPSMFNALITNSEQWSIYNLKAIDYANEDLALFAGDDGIDPVGSRNIRIDNVFVSSGDSPISIKGGIRWPKIGDIVVSNSVIFNYASGGSIGSSDLHKNHISNVTWENIDIVSALFGLTLSNQDGPGSLSDYLYKNIRYEHIRGSLFWVRAPHGPMRRIRYQNISAAMWGTRGAGGDTGNQFSAGGVLNSIDTVIFDGVRVAGELLTAANYTDTLTINDAVKNVSFRNTMPTVVTVTAPRLFTYAGAQPAEFRFQRTGDLAEPLTVPIIVRGTARNGVDYSRLPQQIRFAAGAATATLPVEVDPAFRTADVETVMVSLTGSHSDATMIGPDFHAVVALVVQAPAPSASATLAE